MAFQRGVKTKQRYNVMFEQHDVVLRVVDWNQNEVSLSSGVVLVGDEIRKFRVRCSSAYLRSQLSEIYEESNPTQRDEMVKNAHQRTIRQQSIDRWNQKTADEQLEISNHMRRIGMLVNHAQKPQIVPWNKGLTKTTNTQLMRNSINRSGSNNPMYGTTMSLEKRLEKSALVKGRILAGTWTPCVHNSRTHWDSSFLGKKYRSSWEAMYASINRDDVYETVRIPYVFNNTAHVYIVDFSNDITRTLTEIKPIVHTTSQNAQAKFDAAAEWAASNGYTFRILSESYFVDQYHNIPFDDLVIPNLRQKLNKIKNEANQPS